LDALFTNPHSTLRFAKRSVLWGFVKRASNVKSSHMGTCLKQASLAGQQNPKLPPGARSCPKEPRTTQEATTAGRQRPCSFARGGAPSPYLRARPRNVRLGHKRDHLFAARVMQSRGRMLVDRPDARLPRGRLLRCGPWAPRALQLQSRGRMLVDRPDARLPRGRLLRCGPWAPRALHDARCK